ncbi:MAG: bifunctional folylpolyglutamate synthase/dihydrofolate synthase, partial [Acidimicrobiaceae bacterium]|nr:bifunctional folylpolyglutamate synthase/dihydrofolate synthase [Acidimicrobiaceae bacterium]
LLGAAGLRVGAYTSPHVDTVRERLAIDGQPIVEDAFTDLVADLERYAGVVATAPSYFELLTAAAFLWFSNEAVDAAVVEVGLLGRFDATNVCDSTVSVITNIGRDHTDGAGDWRRDIAREKAGIISAGQPLVLGETSIELLEVFTAESPEPLLVAGSDFGVSGAEQAVGGQLIELWTPAGRHEEVFLPMHGDHQADNAATALMAAEAFLDTPLSSEVVADGLGAARVPGRLEVVATEPLVVLDGAHNQDAARALAAAVPTVFPSGRRILVVGTLGPREPTEFLDELVALSPDLVVACTAPSPRAVQAADLAVLLRERRIEVEVVPDAVDAVRLAVAAADESDLVLVTGSFYVLAAARAALGDVVDLDEDGFDT